MQCIQNRFQIAVLGVVAKDNFPALKPLLEFRYRIVQLRGPIVDGGIGEREKALVFHYHTRGWRGIASRGFRNDASDGDTGHEGDEKDK